MSVLQSIFYPLPPLQKKVIDAFKSIDKGKTRIVAVAPVYNPGKSAAGLTSELTSMFPASQLRRSLIIGLLSALSRGNLTISSSKMADPPIINPNWLTDPTDQEVAVASFKFARSFYKTKSLKGILVGGEVWPGANITTDAEILQMIQDTFSTFYHAAGTCAMGKMNDTMAVVDSKARVIGVEGLRVVDISTFPILPPGQPQASVYMLAEKIAAAILRGS